MKVAFLFAVILLAAACAHHSTQAPGQETVNDRDAASPSSSKITDKGSEKGLVGEWRYADSLQSCHYVFRQDGTFSGEVTYQGERVSQFTGKWSIRRDHLLYHYTGDVLGRIPAGSEDSDKLLAVAKDHFVIEAADGSRRRYQRIK